MCQSDGGEARLGFSMSDIGTYYASAFSLCMKFFKNNYKIWVKSMNYTPYFLQIGISPIKFFISIQYTPTLYSELIYQKNSEMQITKVVKSSSKKEILGMNLVKNAIINKKCHRKRAKKTKS